MNLFLVPFSWIRKSLSLQVFLLVFVSSSSLFIVFAAINIHDIEAMAEGQFIENARNTSDQVNLYLDMYFENIRDIIFLLASQRDLFLPEHGERAQEFLENIESLYASPTIDMIYLVNSENRIITNRQVMFGIFSNPALLELVEETKFEHAKIFVTEPYRSALSGDTLAFMYPVISGAGLREGLIILEVQLDYLLERLSPQIVNRYQTYILTSRMNSVILYDDQSEIIPYTDSVTVPQVEDWYLQMIGAYPQGIHRHEEAILIKSTENVMHWTLYLILNRSRIGEDVKELSTSYWLFLLLWVAFLILFSYFVSKMITNPIRSLAREMDTIQVKGQLSMEPFRRSDEIGSLASSFSALLTRISQLIAEIRVQEQEKGEYRFRMLQSQIGPHFLYNTLASISNMARKQDMDHIRETIKNLIDLLSYSFEKKDSLVPFRDEIRNVTAYVDIMAARYGPLFRLEKDIAVESEDLLVPRLILQPIIENALFHGILPKGTPGTITLQSHIVDKRLIIRISDDGVGMDQDRLTTILQPDTGELHLHDRFNNIGLTNIRNRITHLFGDEGRFTIASHVNEGTVVDIEIPKKNRESN